MDERNDTSPKPNLTVIEGGKSEVSGTDIPVTQVEPSIIRRALSKIAKKFAPSSHPNDKPPLGKAW